MTPRELLAALAPFSSEADALEESIPATLGDDVLLQYLGTLALTMGDLRRARLVYVELAREICAALSDGV